jgi:hypothetical protein
MLIVSLFVLGGLFLVTHPRRKDTMIHPGFDPRFYPPCGGVRVSI